MVMSGQVLESCTTGLRSFSANIRRSAALSRSALDSTGDTPLAQHQYPRDSPSGASARMWASRMIRIALRSRPGARSHIAVPALDGLADHRCRDLIGDLDVP